MNSRRSFLVTCLIERWRVVVENGKLFGAAEKGRAAHLRSVINRPVVFAVIVFFLWFVTQVYAALFWAAGYESAATLEVAANFGVVLAILVWFGSDRQLHPAAADGYRGLGTFVWAPVLMPIYIVQTRGWLWGSVIIVGVLAISLAGEIVGALLAALLFR